MAGFTDPEEARVHKQARDAWLKAEGEALAQLQGRSERVLQFREELTCGCGQKALLTVSLALGTSLKPSQDDLRVGRADTVDRADGALEREAKDSRSGFQAQNAIFDVVHCPLHGRVGEADAKGRAESEEAKTAPPRVVDTLLKDAGFQPVVPEGSPITFFPSPLLAIASIPHDRIRHIGVLATEAIPAAQRIALIREAAEIAVALDEAGKGFLDLVNSRKPDAIADAAGDMSADFFDAWGDAVSVLLLLISGPGVGDQMDEITDRCAFLEGGA